MKWALLLLAMTGQSPQGFATAPAAGVVKLFDTQDACYLYARQMVKPGDMRIAICVQGMVAGR